MIGVLSTRAIERGEDRQIFKDLMIKIGLDVPISGTAHNDGSAAGRGKDWTIAVDHPPRLYAGRDGRRHYTVAR